MTDGPCLQLDLPELFALDLLQADGSWFEDALYWAKDFIRCDDGCY